MCGGSSPPVNRAGGERPDPRSSTKSTVRICAYLILLVGIVIEMAFVTKTEGVMTDDWRLDAACRGETHLMFSEIPAAITQALKLCQHCPVVPQCAAARTPADGGIWGGQRWSSDPRKRRIKERRLRELQHRKAS